MRHGKGYASRQTQTMQDGGQQQQMRCRNGGRKSASLIFTRHMIRPQKKKSLLFKTSSQTKRYELSFSFPFPHLEQNALAKSINDNGKRCLGFSFLFFLLYAVTRVRLGCESDRATDQDLQEAAQHGARFPGSVTFFCLFCRLCSGCAPPPLSH